MPDLMVGVGRASQVMIWGPVVVSDNHRVYGKKGMNTPHARATRARADQFTHILQAGSIPRMMGKREIAMKLLSALAVGLLLAGSLAAQDGDEEATLSIVLQDLLLLAEQGEVGAQIMFGRMYHWGDGVPQDFTEAVKWYRLAAEQGNAYAQTALGVMSYAGDGVPQDATEAVKWFRLAAEQGDADAQTMVGAMYANGDGVLQDYAEAVKWYRLAAEQGIAFAQYNLGLMYERGRGVPQDATEAVRWHRLAAEQGNVEAQASIGLMIGLGQSVPQDFLTAHMWLNIAAANGMEEMVAIRDLVATKMTPAQLTEAQSRASVCMASNYQDCG